tara:strand:- start:238 stop:1443 length:1206 start_codon:yes stop_codon:yes gene_type:complete
MALTIIQTPNDVNLAQSPIVFAVSESNSEAYTSSSFQYLADLYFWTGSLTDSGSSDYTLTKYPNTSRTGIFDVSRIVNSELSDIVQAVSSSVRYIAIDTYTQFLSGSIFVTGSHLKSGVYKAIDGYSVFQEPINQRIEDKTPYWPILTSGPSSQSYQEGTGGRMSLWVGTIGGVAPQVTALIYSSSLDGEDNNYLPIPTGSTTSSEMIVTFPISPSEPDWPMATDLNNFEIFAITGSTNYTGTNKMNENIHFDYVCDTKYDNIRVKWKNRFGGFDYYNFNLVSKESMSTARQRYQPQIGSWNSRGLSYEQYESSTQNYIVDSKQNLSVNSNYVPESYNDIFKELMVSDEVYWVQSYSDTDGEQLMPLAVQTSNFSIKTNKVDKLIQYSFDFIRGQGYKLII